MKRLNSEDAQFGVYLSENTQEIQDAPYRKTNDGKIIMTQEIQEWSDEFDSQNWCCDSIVLDAIKSFISQKLKEQEERHKREIVEIMQEHNE